MSDPVNKPSHYIAAGLEVIDVIETWGLGFHLGNALKYTLRAGRKTHDARQDLAKARWYLRRSAQLVEAGSDLVTIPRGAPIRPSAVSSAFDLDGNRELVVLLIWDASLTAFDAIVQAQNVRHAADVIDAILAEPAENAA